MTSPKKLRRRAGSMSDAPSEILKYQLPVEEMVRLCRAGFSLIPLGGGKDGKSPLLAFKGKTNIPLKRVLGPMRGKGTACYGIRLGGLLVIDCDEDDPDLIRSLEARFGPSPVHVRTPRGWHLYYLYAGGEIPNLRGEGLHVDIKCGASSYVMGPCSVRPDGGCYEPAKGLLGRDELPAFRGAAKVTAASVPIGNRHVQLVKEAICMVEFVDDAEELQANLVGIREDLCEDPEGMSDDELRDIAEWAWKRRLENSVYRGRDSAFPIQRLAVDALKSRPNSTDAIALLVLLLDQHGHSPGKRFPLAFHAMRKAGLVNMSIDRLRAARRTLEDVGLLRLAGKHRAGSRPQTFVLTRMLPDLADVERLPTRSAPRPSVEGEGSKITYDAQFRPYKSAGQDDV